MAKAKTHFKNCHGIEFPIHPATDLNLDAMPYGDDYLMSFWAHYQRGRNARELFPQGGKGTRNATAGLAQYACNRHVARACRLRGDINTATTYEDICDRIYDRLPDWARGW